MDPSVRELISELEGVNIPLIYLDADATDITLVSGFKCDRDTLEPLTLREQKPSVQELLCVDEFDDDGF